MTTEHFSVGILCATEGVLLILTVYLWSKSSSESRRFVPFRRFVTLSAVACLTEIIYSCLVNIHYSMPGIFYQSLYGLSVFMGMLATCSLYLYVVQFLRVADAEIRLLRIVRYAVIVLDAIILAANYVTGHVARYNTAGYVVTGPLYVLVSYVLPFYFVIIIIVLAIVHYRQFDKNAVRAFAVVTLVSLLFYPVQMLVFPDVLSEYFIAGLFAVVMFFAVETSPVNRLLKAEEQLQEAYRQTDEATRSAMQASRAKSDFLSSMSHEIRTPMNAIIGMNDMIIQETKSTQIRSYAFEIRKSGNHLLHVINDILDYSRMETGKTELRIGSYSLSALLNRLYEAAEEPAREKGLSLSVDADKSLPDRLIGDEERLFQSVRNLLENAVKYTEHGSVKLTVNGVRRDMNLTLFFKVTDTGIGIGRENMQKIFDSFSRVNIERTRNILGTGLGLAITSKLVTMMGGDVSVRSEEGTGSAFTIRISQKILSEMPGEGMPDLLTQNMHRGDVTEGIHPMYGDMRVLVVDDNSVNLRIVSMLLKPYGIDAKLASSGEACLKAVSEEAFDLVFLDHLMPGMDGTETLLALRAAASFDSAKTKVIALTADDDPNARQRFMELGFDGYLTKPVDKKQLERILSACSKGGHAHGL